MADSDTPLEVHPWNHDFTWHDHSGPFRALTDEQAAAFDHDGFFVLGDLLDGETVRDVRDEIDRYEAARSREIAREPNQQSDISELGAVTFTGSLVERSPRLRELISSRPLADVVCDLLGPDVILYWDDAVYKKTEKPRRFPWHQDTGFVFVEPQAYVTVWLALTDATAENGCIQVVPGLHRRGTLRHYYVEPLGFECFAEHERAVVLELPAGSAVIFSSLTPHMTGPNVTNDVRKAYIIQYAVAGTEKLVGDPESDGTPERVACTKPRQLPIASAGHLSAT
jgi:phytanoyl-CoA hydroxylase